VERVSAGGVLHVSLPPSLYRLVISDPAPALPVAHADDPPTPDPLPPQLPHNLPDFSHHIHILLLRTTGVIYKPADALCSILGILLRISLMFYVLCTVSQSGSSTRSPKIQKKTPRALSHSSHTYPFHLIIKFSFLCGALQQQSSLKAALVVYFLFFSTVSKMSVCVRL